LHTRKKVTSLRTELRVCTKKSSKIHALGDAVWSSAEPLPPRGLGAWRLALSPRNIRVRSSFCEALEIRHSRRNNHTYHSRGNHHVSSLSLACTPTVGLRRTLPLLESFTRSCVLMTRAHPPTHPPTPSIAALFHSGCHNILRCATLSFCSPLPCVGQSWMWAA
jgi:hypothetical protein